MSHVSWSLDSLQSPAALRILCAQWKKAMAHLADCHPGRWRRWTVSPIPSYMPGIRTKWWKWWHGGGKDRSVTSLLNISTSQQTNSTKQKIPKRTSKHISAGCIGTDSDAGVSLFVFMVISCGKSGCSSMVCSNAANNASEVSSKDLKRRKVQDVQAIIHLCWTFFSFVADLLPHKLMGKQCEGLTPLEKNVIIISEAVEDLLVHWPYLAIYQKQMLCVRQCVLTLPYVISF